MPADQAQITNTGGLLYAIRAEGTSLVACSPCTFLFDHHACVVYLLVQA